MHCGKLCGPGHGVWNDVLATMYILLFPPLLSMSVFKGEFVKHFNFHNFCLESEIESLTLREEQRLLDQSVIAFSHVCLPPPRVCL